MRNLNREDADHLALACSSPASPVSGQAVRAGSLTGVAFIDENTAGLATVDLGSRVYNLPVKGVNDSGNSAVALFDELWFNDGDAFLSKKSATGYFFGHAMATVNSAATATVAVRHASSFGSGALGSIGSGGLAAGSVIASKLSATLKTGFIPLDFTVARILSSNAVQNTTEGGVPDGNTAPILARKNGATDIALQLSWAATVVAELQFAPFALPPDVDDAATLTINLLISKDTNTDTTAVVAVKIFQGIGDTNAGGNTAALATASLTKYTVTMAAADLAAYPSMINVALVPGTHANDAVILNAAWVEYTRA